MYGLEPWLVFCLDLALFLVDLNLLDKRGCRSTMNLTREKRKMK